MFFIQSLKIFLFIYKFMVFVVFVVFSRFFYTVSCFVSVFPLPLFDVSAVFMLKA